MPNLMRMFTEVFDKAKICLPEEVSSACTGIDSQDAVRALINHRSQ